MAPSDYVLAREQKKTNDQSSFVTMMMMIDEQPYLPLLEMDPNNHDSIKSVVAEILKANTNTNNTELDTTHWTVDTVSGGITNKLFRVSGLPVDAKKPNSSNNNNNDNNNNSLLVRVFGGHGLIDRDVETATYAALAQQGMAVAYYGRFANGRLEDWCEGYQPLEVTQLADAATPIARALGQIHATFEVSKELQTHHNPNQPPTLWTQLDDWWKQATNTVNTTNMGNNDNLNRQAAALELEKLGTEIAWLQSDVIDCKGSKVGFCHNDLLAANILYKKGGGDDDNNNSNSNGNTISAVQLIDFEYGGMNYLSYDIANHFNEYAGGTTSEDNGITDYSRFPTEELQRRFVTEYLKGTTTTTTTTNNDERVDALLEEIRGFVLANHLVWGLWAVNQAAAEGCDEFDYMKYAESRLGQYWIDKKKAAAAAAMEG